MAIGRLPLNAPPQGRYERTQWLMIRMLRTTDDLIKAATLYRDHAGAYLPIPDPDDLHTAIEDQQIFGILEEDSRLVAVGGTFPVARCQWDGGRPIAVYELAGLVVHPDVRRLDAWRLQDILVAVRSIHMALQQASGLCLISSVASGNVGSRKSMERCGLRPLDETAVPQWLRDVRRTWLTGQKPDVVDYIVPPSAIGTLRHLLQDALGREAIKVVGETGKRIYRLRFDDAHLLADLIRPNGEAPAWETEVPRVRLIGKTPPFLRWPR